MCNEQDIYTSTRHTHNNTIYTGLTLYESTWHNPLDDPLMNPLDNSPYAWRTLPCSRIPLTYLESLLCVWCDPCPLWSQVVNWPPPLPFPSPFSFLAPLRFPIPIVCPCTTTSWPQLHIVWYNIQSISCTWGLKLNIFINVIKYIKLFRYVYWYAYKYNWIYEWVHVHVQINLHLS